MLAKRFTIDHTFVMRGVFLLFVAACGVRVENNSAGAIVDAAVEVDATAEIELDAAVVADSPPDAPRVCEGGDAALQAADGSCLLLFTTPRNFLSADLNCAVAGARLAILTTVERDAAAKQLVGARNVWIGLSDQDVEGTFAWIDATPLAFQNFSAGEPNNANGAFQEDCVIYNGTKDSWDDRPCSNAVPGRGQVPGEYAFLCAF